MDTQLLNSNARSLPVSRQRREPTDAVHSWNNVDVPPTGWKRVKKILVVEDDSSISQILKDLLIEMGYEVVIAANGREGLQVVEAHSIDGILLDLEMPVMNGQTMLDELRWRNDEVPVIVMSGRVPWESMRNLLREGAQGFLTKPFRLEDLQQKSSQIFGAPINQREREPGLIAS